MLCGYYARESNVQNTIVGAITSFYYVNLLCCKLNYVTLLLLRNRKTFLKNTERYPCLPV